MRFAVKTTCRNSVVVGPLVEVAVWEGGRRDGSKCWMTAPRGRMRRHPSAMQAILSG